jgi:hypothetical protein
MATVQVRYIVDHPHATPGRQTVSPPARREARRSAPNRAVRDRDTRMAEAAKYPLTSTALCPATCGPAAGNPSVLVGRQRRWEPDVRSLLDFGDTQASQTVHLRIRRYERTSTSGESHS